MFVKWTINYYRRLIHLTLLTKLHMKNKCKCIKATFFTLISAKFYNWFVYLNKGLARERLEAFIFSRRMMDMHNSIQMGKAIKRHNSIIELGCCVIVHKMLSCVSWIYLILFLNTTFHQTGTREHDFLNVYIEWCRSDRRK